MLFISIEVIEIFVSVNLLCNLRTYTILTVTYVKFKIWYAQFTLQMKGLGGQVVNKIDLSQAPHLWRVFVPK
jgi:hypothetical protein